MRPKHFKNQNFSPFIVKFNKLEFSAPLNQIRFRSYIFGFRPGSSLKSRPLDWYAKADQSFYDSLSFAFSEKAKFAL